MATLKYSAILVLARAGLIFAVAKRGHGQVILYLSFSRKEGRGPSSHVFLGLRAHVQIAHFLYTPLITVFAVTVYFLTSLLFPVNCSYRSS